jgi:ribosomal protein S18 acetylase RimI-like enzyme
VTAPTEDAQYVERGLRLEDVERALRLSIEAGWNQTGADWRYLLEAGRGFAMWTPDGKLVATAITLPYRGGFGWISMVLVHTPDRGRGLASRLMRRCVATLRAEGLVPVLDATPGGREVYRRIGFRDAWSMRRLRARTAVVPRRDRESPVAIRPFGADDLAAVVACDRAAFGADRSALLAHLRTRLPAVALLAERDGRVAGFALARDGRTAAQLGPVVADDARIAHTLIACALGEIAGPAIVDVPERHATTIGWLRAAGFEDERPFTRMLHERTEPFDQPALLYAIAGPELG